MSDQQTENEDWIKTLSWDLPTTLDGVVWAMGAVNKDDAGKVAALRHLMTLPAWTAAPADLKTAVEQYLAKPVLGRSIRRWNSESRDWATWDADHRYIPHPTEQAMSVHQDPINIGGLHADAVVSVLGAGQHMSIDPSALPSVVDSMKTSENPVNLENLHINGQENLFDKNSMDLPRVQMPVISDTADAQNFAQTLAGSGVTASWESVDPTTLTATQNELDGVKVAGMLGAMRANDGVLGSPPPPVLVTDRAGNLLDGHHRWAAAAAYAVENPGFKVPIVRLDTDIQTLVPLGHQYDASIPGHEQAKAFGQRTLLNTLLALRSGGKAWATPPADAPPVPDASKPYFWLDGRGWVLMATDTQDGIPRSLDNLPKAQHG